MRGGKDKVPAIRGNENLLFDGETAPKQKDKVLANLRKSLNNRVGELLPTDACVAGGHVGAHCERSVQKQNSLMRPAFQISVWRWRDAQIVLEFLENVNQRWWWLDSVWHGEAKSVSLSWIVVRVLPDDDGLDFIDGAKIECRKNLRTGRINDMVLRMFLQKLCLDLLKVRLFELVGEQFQPRWFKFNGHD